MQTKKIIMAMYIFLFTLFVLFSQSAISAEIHGEVRLHNNTPVPYAYVYAKTSDYLNSAEAYSDFNGKFSVTKLVSGSWVAGEWSIQAYSPSDEIYRKYANSEIITVNLKSANEIITLPAPLFLKTSNVIGRVLLSDGTSVNSASIHVKGDNSDLYQIFSTENSGYIKLNLPSGEYSLDIEPSYENAAAGWIRNYKFTVTDPNSILDLKNIILPQYYKKISGTMKTSEGSAVADIWVFAENMEKEIYRYSLTDDDGNFEIWVNGGEWEVYTYEEYTTAWVCPESRNVTFAEDDTQEIIHADITLLKPAGYLKGKVIDPSGIPLKNYSVYVEAFNVETGTDALVCVKKSGDFSLPLLDGPYEVSIYIEDAAIYPDLSVPAPLQVKIDNKDEYIGTVSLISKDCSVSGIIKDKDGNKIAGIFADAFDSVGRWLSSVTDADGYYNIKLTPGEWTVTLFIPEEISYIFKDFPRQIHITDKDNKRLDDFVLEKTAATVTGKIQDQNGNILNNIEAWAYARFEDESNPFVYSWVKNGEFSVNIPAEKVFIGLEFPPNSEYLFTKETEVKPEPTSVILQVSKTDALIQGKIKDSKGNPITGISGRVLASLRNTGSWQIADINPYDGAFKMNVSEGTWDMSYELETDKYVFEADSPMPVSVRAKETVFKDFTLKRLDYIVRGEVQNPDGEPVPNIQTWIRIPYTGENGESIFENMVFTDNEGKFIFYTPSNEGTGSKRKAKIGTALKSLEEGILQKRTGTGKKKGASSQQSEPVAPSRQTTGEVILKLREADTYLTGKVVDEKNQPVENAFVSAYSADGQKADGYTDANGYYELFVAKAVADGSNIWNIRAVYEPADVNSFYQSNEAEADISGNDEKITVSDLFLKFMGTLPKGISDTFPVKKGWCNLLSDGIQIYIPTDAVSVQELKNRETKQVIFTDSIKIVIKPGIAGFPDNAEDYLTGYGYSIAMYEKENGKMILKKSDKDIMISLPYTDAALSRFGITEENIVPAYFLETSSSWQKVKGATIDKENKQIHFRTRYLSSKWALVAKREIFKSGDIDSNGTVDLRDAISGLQICVQVPVYSTISTEADVNEDRKIGLEDVIYILQKITAVRN